MKDLCFISKSLHGPVIDLFPDVHPDILEHYHGLIGDQVQHRPNQTGACHPLDAENKSDLEAMASEVAQSDVDHADDDCFSPAIAMGIHTNIHHMAVQVPCSCTPFPDLAYKALFTAAIEEIQHHHLIPPGDGLRSEEWNGDEYPVSELIKFG